MRPDEHKRKKNAQYKKKHGIGDKQQQQQAGSKKTSLDQKVDQSADYDAQKQKLKQVREQAIRTGVKTLGYSEDGFQCRKLESNWQKYEENIDSDEELKAGADFNQLLAGKLNTAFDKAALKPTGLKPDGATSEGIPAMLSINAEHLLSAIRCVPLNNWLNISSEYFEEEQLAEFSKIAEENSKCYAEKFAKEKEASTRVTKEEIGPESNNKAGLVVQPSANVDQDISLTVETVSGKLPTRVATECEEPLDMLLDQDHEKSDLDKILSSTHVVQSNIGSYTLTQQPELDVPLISQKPAVVPDNQMPSISQKVTSKTNEDAKHNLDSNLESWLDDFLDS